MAQAHAATPDYADWQQTATRAEDAIEAARASDSAFQSLRAELDRWRTEFVAAGSANAKTIGTVKDQLDALGTLAEGDTEPADITRQRQELNDRLAELQVPAKTALVAQSRAEGLIKGIDTILRDRQTDALAERGATPLSPSLWLRGWSTLTRAWTNTRNEVSAAWANPLQRDAFKRKLPFTMVLFIIGSVLVLRGRRWMLKWARNVSQKPTTATRWLSMFVLSLGQVALPYAGLMFLLGAAYSTDLIGLRGDAVLSSLGNAGFVLLLAMWLGARMFPRNDSELHLLKLGPDHQRKGRLYAGLVGLVLAVGEVAGQLASYDSWPADVRATIYFPLLALGGLLLWQLGRLLQLHGRAAIADSGEATRYADHILSVIGRVLMVVAVIGPLLAAAGYFRAAMMVIVPSLQTLLLMAFVLVLQRVVAEIYVLLRGGADAAREGLVPVLAGFTLFLLSGPAIALIWGVSETQLLSLWKSAMNGFQLGETRISVAVFLKFAIVFVAGYGLTRLLQGTLKNTVLPKTRMDSGGQNALVSGLGYVGIFLAAIVAITSAGIDLSSLAIVAGALSVGIGFGLQNIVSNFVAGIILLIERPISEGDWIEVGGQMGYVRDISVRSTRIETFDRTDVIVPNADFVSGTVTNFTRGNTVGRVIVPVGVAYGTDTKRVEAILREIANDHPMVLAHPEPNIVFQRFGADSLDFEIRAILRDVNWVTNVKSDMNHAIARRFAEEGIEIPFAQRDIWLRNPEALNGQGARRAGSGAQPAAGAHRDEDADGEKT